MKDFFSSFDRFAASFATGSLLLIGIYLNISAAVRPSYDTLNSFMQGPATAAIFSIPLLIFAYILGAVNTTVATLFYDWRCKPYNDEYLILDSIEAREHPILAKEIADLLNAKRLLLSSTLPLALIAIGLVCLRDRVPGYSQINWLGAIFISILTIAAPSIARCIHRNVREIHRSLPPLQKPRKDA
jgi:hypothetical protein